jgi:cephalosporin-C deacetylase-like acetyl esterase
MFDELRFASIDEALQHLANVSGKQVVVHTAADLNALMSSFGSLKQFAEQHEKDLEKIVQMSGSKATTEVVAYDNDEVEVYGTQVEYDKDDNEHKAEVKFSFYDPENAPDRIKVSVRFSFTITDSVTKHTKTVVNDKRKFEVEKRKTTVNEFLKKLGEMMWECIPDDPEGYNLWKTLFD